MTVCPIVDDKWKKTRTSTLAAAEATSGSDANKPNEAGNAVEKLEQLLSTGADIDACDRYGQTALMNAARIGHSQVGCLINVFAPTAFLTSLDVRTIDR